MRKLFVAFCVVLLLTQLAFASEPAPMSTSVPMPVQQEWKILAGISVQAFYEDAWQTLHSHMRYAHCNGRYMDGGLSIMPLDIYIQSEEIPTVRLSEDFGIRIIEPTDVDSYSYKFEIYRMTETGLELCLEQEPEWQELSEGLYLITIPHSLDIGEEYYSGVCFLWLEVIGVSMFAEGFSLHNGTQFDMTMEEVIALESQNGVILNSVTYNDHDLIGYDTIANCPDTKITYTFAEDGGLQSMLYTFQTDDQRDLLEEILTTKYGETKFNSTTQLSFPCVDSDSWGNTPFTFDGQYGFYEQKRADFSHRLIFTPDHRPVLIEHFVSAYYSHFSQSQMAKAPARLENMIRYTLLNNNQAEMILSAISSVEDDL